MSQSAEVPESAPRTRSVIGLRQFFDVVDIPAPGVPVDFAIALPTPELRALPGVPHAAMPEAGRMASGRGIGVGACRASCLGEAVELFSCSAWGDEALTRATAPELGAAAILPEALNGFSRPQIERRFNWNRRFADFDWRPAARTVDGPMEWLAVDNAFTGKGAFVPADFAFIGRRLPGEEEGIAIGDSNGCAAGHHIDAARLAGTLELIERDATARWWYGRRRRAHLPLTLLDNAVGSFLVGRRRRSVLFDITPDIGVPVIAAVSAEADGSDVTMGFAARFDIAEAALGAATEMLQMEVSLESARQLGEAAGLWARWRRMVTMALPPLDAAALPVSRPPDAPRIPGIGLSAILERFATRGIDLYFADLTRNEFDVPVCRAMSTALCLTKPRFGRARLLAPDAGDHDRVKTDVDTQVPLYV